MAKKSRKDRKSAKKKSKATANKSNLSPVELLQLFRSNFNEGNWIQALTIYREWTNKTGTKRTARIEGELLYRCASGFFATQHYDQCKRLLTEAITKDPHEKSRYLLSRGLTHVRMGMFARAVQDFQEAGEEYHFILFNYLLESGMPLPEKTGDAPIADKNALLSFLKSFIRSDQAIRDTDLTAAKAGDGHKHDNLKQPALKNLLSVYDLVLSDANGHKEKLKLLSRQDGFIQLANHLLFIGAIKDRNTVKIRNLLRKSHKTFDKPTLNKLLDLYLLVLLKEENFKEIEYLGALINQLGLAPSSFTDINNEACFRMALSHINNEHWQKALDYMERITAVTSQVLHNRALLYRKLGEISAENKEWTQLLHMTKKPKKTDPIEEQNEYAITLKHIGENYLREEEFEQAETYFKQARGVLREDQDILYGLLKIYEATFRPAEALQYAEKLYELDPADPEYIMGIIASLTALRKIKELIAFLEKQIDSNSELGSIQELLLPICSKTAFDIHIEEPAKALGLLQKFGKKTFTGCYGRYMHGFYYYKASQFKKAEKEFNAAIKLIKSHEQQISLGIAFYKDGIVERAMELFEKIMQCGCQTSIDIFYEEILPFLIDTRDTLTLERVCSFAYEKAGFNPGSIADQLFEAGLLKTAKKYCLHLINQVRDEESLFLYLIILNELGQRAEALEIAEELLELSRKMDDPKLISFYKNAIKQIKNRGHAKLLA